MLTRYVYGAVDILLDATKLSDGGSLNITDEVTMPIVKGHKYLVTICRTRNETYISHGDTTTGDFDVDYGPWSDTSTIFLIWRANSSDNIPFTMYSATFKQ